ncbi:MAG: hypothetical protein K2J47_05330 [Ruminococcus sp.]|nr:hypothetical protein [Ruminococcus sp.]MDE6788727.1 hypothetical protein [Ruminococcus sp.]
MGNLLTELNEMRHNLSAARPVKRTKPPMVYGLKKDPLGDIYQSADKLINEGEVYYGVIVQANELLFHKYNPFNVNYSCDCPMNIIYSKDNFFNVYPELLHEAASYIYSFKNTENAPPEIKRIVDSVTDEYERLFNVPVYVKDIPAIMEIAPEVCNATVYFTTVMVFRQHLPRKYLKGWFLPIIACDDCCSVMVLPKKYWTENFIRYLW